MSGMHSEATTPDFSPLDLTVVVLLYRRTECFAEQIRRLGTQSFRGSYELILWNHGPPLAPEAEAAARAQPGPASVTIVQSSSNYIGRARFAAAELARGRLFMLCDDDIVPQAGYLQGFVDRFESHAGPVVLCGGGHVFDAARFTQQALGRALPETRVDFAHGNSLLTSTEIFRRAARVPLPHTDYYWLDDLWLSYVWTAMHGVPLLKIKADHLYDEHPSWRDPQIALCLSPAVFVLRSRFLREYLRPGSGWPLAREEPIAVAGAHAPVRIPELPWQIGRNEDSPLIDAAAPSSGPVLAPVRLHSGDVFAK